MGGRGGSSGFSANLSVTGLTAQDGTAIDLSEFPLTYGQPANLTNEERKAVDAFEKKRYLNKIEYGTLIAVDGSVLIEKRGGSGSVSMPAYLYDIASVMSHNHPRSGTDVGQLGGTFSKEDLNVLGSSKLTTMRATALEGTYSITKSATYDGAGLEAYYRGEEKRLHQIYKTNTDIARQKYEAVRIAALNGQVGMREHDAALEEAYSVYNYEFNREIVGLHNALLSGQKKFGYTYTLERR